MRVVFDINVLLSALLFGGLPRTLLELALRGDLLLVTSVELLDELEDVLTRKARFSRAAARLSRAELEQIARIVDPERVAGVSRDPDDDVVLAVAVAGCARAIVTGNQDLLVLEAHQGIPVLSPRELLRRLNEAEGLQ